MYYRGFKGLGVRKKEHGKKKSSSMKSSSMKSNNNMRNNSNLNTINNSSMNLNPNPNDSTTAGIGSSPLAVPTSIISGNMLSLNLAAETTASTTKQDKEEELSPSILELEKEKEEEGEEEEGGEEVKITGNVYVAEITIVIILSLLFEAAEDHARDRLEEEHKFVALNIMDACFGELTILGFIGLAVSECCFGSGFSGFRGIRDH